MTGGPRIYLFRSDRLRGTNTFVCAAPFELAAAVYGGGGLNDEHGVQRAFGGSAFYRDSETGQRFIGVWGARNAARFRVALKRHTALTVVREHPPASLVSWGTTGPRPPSSRQRRRAGDCAPNLIAEAEPFRTPQGAP